jgi:hypothetical protein
MDWEGSLHANAERLLADGERFARAAALAGDHNAFEDLRTTTFALDHLKMNFDPVAWGEVGHAAQLCAFKIIDY